MKIDPELARMVKGWDDYPEDLIIMAKKLESWVTQLYALAGEACRKKAKKDQPKEAK